DVSFNLQRGEILALVGENGAGKSTLVQVLAGVQKPEAGDIFLEEKKVNFYSAYDALDTGIGIVFQELSLVDGLSVAENIFANRQPVGKLNIIRWKQLYDETRRQLNRFNLDIDPATPVKRFSMGKHQILEILKAISSDPKILILDEPTSSLTEAEADELFNVIRRLQLEGMSFIYITHKLGEVFELADRVMVMRDGRYVGSESVCEVNENALVAMMVGREINDMYGATSESALPPEEYFRIEGFTRRGVFQDVSFGLRRGEILGLAGLIGAGRTEIARAIAGIDPKDSGKITLENQPVEINNPQDAIEQGVAYLPEDRKGQGLFLDMSVLENLIAPVLRQFTNQIGFLNRTKIHQNVAERIDQFGITTPSQNQKMLNLSGGNQQKCMIAMWMGIQPRVTIFDEPTRGVDVGARSDIYHKLRELSEAGTGIIMISSELPELLGICDRILVIHRGQVSGEVSRNEYSEELILEYAAGIKNHREH
ncbi:MAG: sugar ABC transporter ATP-binding protein, partial [Anaerolineales bacterium]